MFCPFCKHEQSRVVDSRTVEDGYAIRRRRECTSCRGRFSTLEKSVLLVEKRNGVLEDFSREKLIRGVQRACQGRDVSEDALKRLAQQVEVTLRAHGGSHVPSNAVGLAVLEPLRKLDEVAYMRFASVYKSFDSIHDFEQEIDSLKELRRHGGSAKSAARADQADRTQDADSGDPAADTNRAADAHLAADAPRAERA